MCVHCYSEDPDIDFTTVYVIDQHCSRSLLGMNVLEHKRLDNSVLLLSHVLAFGVVIHTMLCIGLLLFVPMMTFVCLASARAYKRRQGCRWQA